MLLLPVPESRNRGRFLDIGLFLRYKSKLPNAKALFFDN
jgi:hypothetical protein